MVMNIIAILICYLPPADSIKPRLLAADRAADKAIQNYWSESFKSNRNTLCCMECICKDFDLSSLQKEIMSPSFDALSKKYS